MSTVLLVAMAAVMGVLSLVSDSGAEERRPTLTVKLRNDANVSTAMLRPAQEIVERMFDAAGVDVVWEGMSMVMVVLSAREPAELSSRVDVLGFATGTHNGRGRVAYIVMPRVREFTRESPTNEPAVLGAAIAHEIGHLLLPHNSHSKAGLMRRTFALGDFKKARLGKLVFAIDQAASIRSGIESRRQIASAQSDSHSLVASFEPAFTPVEMSPEHEVGH